MPSVFGVITEMPWKSHFAGKPLYAAAESVWGKNLLLTMSECERRFYIDWLVYIKNLMKELFCNSYAEMKRLAQDRYLWVQRQDLAFREWW
jgi:hypothetical protein